MTADRPIVSVVIPTRNAARTLGLCIKSIWMQDLDRGSVEVVVVDGYSEDKTVEIAEQLGAEVIQTDWGLLGARFLGFHESEGRFILQFDSDQFFKRADCLLRAVRMMNEYDMLNLEQFTFRPSSWIQLLYDADMRLMQRLSRELHPLEGVLYPRFFKREILDRVYSRIPRAILPFTFDHEDVIIHYEALKASNKIGVLRDAVWHIDPRTIWEVWRKMEYNGRTCRRLQALGYYSYPISYKRIFRLREIAFLLQTPLDVIKSYLLLLIKLLPYTMGKLTFRVKQGDSHTYR